MQGHGAAHLDLVLGGNLIRHLFLLMQNGFSLKIPAMCSLKAFLTERMGLNPDYVEEKIQTIFLDGRPVDDLDAAIVGDGSSLALSGAMPGLVGAAMRRGGFYGQLRSAITYRPSGASDTAGVGTVHVKIFNVLMHDLGPDLLRKGIYVPSKDLAVFLSRQPEEFWAGCTVMTLDGEAVSRDLLFKDPTLSRHELTHLSVQTRP